jgi:hypothetical protein
MEIVEIIIKVEATMNLIMTGTQEGTVGADFCWGKS